MTPRRTDEQVEDVQKDTVATEKKLKEKRRERAAKKTDPPSANERLVAPIVLILTVLISYVIVLFGS